MGSLHEKKMEPRTNVALQEIILAHFLVHPRASSGEVAKKCEIDLFAVDERAAESIIRSLSSLIFLFRLSSPFFSTPHSITIFQVYSRYILNMSTIFQEYLLEYLLNI